MVCFQRRAKSEPQKKTKRAKHVRDEGREGDLQVVCDRRHGVRQRLENVEEDEELVGRGGRGDHRSAECNETVGEEEESEKKG